MFNKSIRNYSTNNNNFAIIASLARSFDTSHIENNRIHLISSIFLLEFTYYENVNTYLRGFKDTEKIKYVFILTPNLAEFIITKVTDQGGLIIIQCSVATLLKNLFFTEASDSLFNNIFGKLDLESKDFYTISQQSIFVFLNQTWSNVVLNFKLNKVDLSGGSISKRHVLQTVDLQLVLFLLNILNESKLPNVIHNSLNNSILSSSIPIDYYKKFVGIDFLNMKVKDIEHNYTSSKMDDSSFNAESSFPDHNLFLKIILSNIILSKDMLIQDISDGLKNELDKLKEKIESYSSEIVSLSYQKSCLENIDNVSTKSMRNKYKKRFKKERTLLKKEGISTKVSALNSEISSLNQRKAFIKEQIISKESELKQFNQNSKEYSISDLINLQKKYVNINKDIYKYKKNRKLNNVKV